MQRSSLLNLLQAHLPFDEQEQRMWLETIRFVEQNPDCFERWLTAGHITGSAWIVDKAQNCVLLMHHRKLDRWFQPGGHADGDPDILRVALKEAQEETGLTGISPEGSQLFDIDVHLIPATVQIPAHYHYDMRFLMQADSTLPLQSNNESKALAWVTLEEVADYNNSESILRMVRKTKS
ncbi:MAG: NUDIX hydrolase [Spirosomataceae bacterium]